MKFATLQERSPNPDNAVANEICNASRMLTQPLQMPLQKSFATLQESSPNPDNADANEICNEKRTLTSPAAP
jgi:hypothetical protein